MGIPALIPQVSVGNAQDLTSAVEPVKAKKSGKCWKCAVDTHAAKDCIAQHYCLVCNNAAHPTVRCPTLKLQRPSAFVTGNGTEETIFLQLPSSVFKGHLKPKNAPVAKVTITGVVVPSTAIEAVMARICPLNLQWKWEALYHDAASFLVNFPSIQDLDRVNGIQMGVPDYDAQFKISKWEIQDIQPKFDLPQLWVHVEGVPHFLRHFHGLWAIGSLLGTTVDVDLPTLYSQNVVRILVAMMSPDTLNKHQDEKGHYVDVTVTLKLQGYNFHCRKQKAGFQPDSNYSHFF
jgi:hypothetical protein